MMSVYKSAFEEFSSACRFGEVKKSIACLKQALRLDGIIESDLVAEGTRALTETERGEFAKRYSRIKEVLSSATDPIWISRM